MTIFLLMKYWTDIDWIILLLLYKSLLIWAILEILSSSNYQPEQLQTIIAFLSTIVISLSQEAHDTFLLVRIQYTSKLVQYIIMCLKAAVHSFVIYTFPRTRCAYHMIHALVLQCTCQDKIPTPRVKISLNHTQVKLLFLKLFSGAMTAGICVLSCMCYHE